MNKSLTMKYYNKLRQTNRALAKTKEGRSMIRREAIFSAKVIPVLEAAANIVHFVTNMFNYRSRLTPPFPIGGNAIHEIHANVIKDAVVLNNKETLKILK